MKKNLKISATKHPQTTELATLEQEKESFQKEALNYKAKVLQLEKEKENWLQGQVGALDMVVIIPAYAKSRSNTDGLIQAMSQLILQIGEIKILKEALEKLKQEMKIKDEKMTPLQRENKDLQERLRKMKMRLKGKTLLQGAKHVIWDAIVAKAAKFRVYLNFINDKDGYHDSKQVHCC